MPVVIIIPRLREFQMLWAKAFNAIVNLNNMLENLDEQ